MLFQSVSDTQESSAPRARRPAPGVRAVAGGALVSCAMLGVLVAPGGAEEAERRYLVAAVTIAPGEPLEPSLVEPMAMSLPPSIARRAFTQAGEVESLTARVAIPAGSLLHAGQVTATSASAARGPELTVSVPVRHALGGRLATGDLIDVIATYGSGTDGFSEVVAAGAVVTDIVDATDTLGVEPTLTITIRLGAHGDVLAVVHAAHAEALSLVFDAVDADQVDEGPGATFRPTPPDPVAGS